MRALVWQGPERMAMEDVPEPAATPGMVVVQSQAAGICGSEIEGYLGRMGNRKPPLIMGHEFAGTVVEVGEGVDASWEGRRVCVNPIRSCGRCRLCRSSMRNLCPTRSLVGVHHPGGFASRVEVPVECLVELPSGVDPRTGALVEPLANGIHAVRLGMAGHEVLHAAVIGAGTIGLMAMQSAVVSGIPQVVVLEPHPARRRHALLLGAHHAFASAEEARDHLYDVTEGLGLDLVLDAVGLEATRRAALELVRPGGRIVLIGLHDDLTSLGFHALIRGQLCLQGSYAYTDDDFRQGLDWAAEGRVGIGALPPVLPLERGPDIFATLSAGPQDQIKVFLGDPA